MKTLLLASLASLALATAAQAASASRASSSSATSSAPATYYYSQSSGQLAGGKGAGPILTQGYSGRGPGLNNPSAQAVRNTGPIPRGTYNATGVTSSKGPNTVVLSPSSRTNTHGRDAFRVHGDNRAANNTASHGCIIVGPGVRSVISNQVRSGRPVQIHVTK